MTRRLLLWVLAWASLLQAGLSFADNVVPGEVTFDTAVLHSPRGQRTVKLPHALEQGDFDPEGGIVKYRIDLTLATQQGDRSIYIQKMSRSGRVYLNGQEVGSCGYFSLDKLRCHHQPQFFRPPANLWREGLNTLEVEVYANKTQANGLSQVSLGDTTLLYKNEFRPHFRWQVELIDWLASVMIGLGLLSLVTFYVFRHRSIYLWFGLTCLGEALSSTNILVTAPPFGFFWFDWLVFASRLVTACFLGLTFLTFFRKQQPWLTTSLLLYALASTFAIPFLDNDPRHISKLYLPLQAVTVCITLASLVWAWRSRKMTEIVMSLTLMSTLAISIVDVARLRSESSFTGVYLIVYASAIMLVFVGMSMISMLIVALRTSRDWSSTLKQKLGERETSLRKVYDQLLVLEGDKARSDERERLMRDMHDGFMSTLAITRVGLQSGKTSIAQAANYIGDCLDDLRLVLDTSTAISGSLDTVLADFLHRFERRLILAGIEPSSEIELEGMPGLSSTQLLHVMRLLQEAINNVIRHAHAKHLSLSAHWDAAAGQLRIAVVDDGHHPQQQEFKVGRGLTNMRNRALALHGHLDIHTTKDGTSVRMTMPITPG
jgi:signal transduction histidine kinase